MHTAIAQANVAKVQSTNGTTLSCVIHSSFPFLSQKAWHDPPLQTARQNLLSTSWTNDTTKSCAPVIPHTRCMQDPPKPTDIKVHQNMATFQYADDLVSNGYNAKPAKSLSYSVGFTLPSAATARCPLTSGEEHLCTASIPFLLLILLFKKIFC